MFTRAAVSHARESRGGDSALKTGPDERGQRLTYVKCYSTFNKTSTSSSSSKRSEVDLIMSILLTGGTGKTSTRLIPFLRAHNVDLLSHPAPLPASRLTAMSRLTGQTLRHG